MERQPSFWNIEDRLRQLSVRGDPLEKLSATVDFDLFRAEPQAALGSRDLSMGGSPPFDVVLKLRMLVLQALYSLSLDQIAYLVRHRLRTSPAITESVWLSCGATV